MRFQPDNRGKNNPSYKGDNAGYNAIHAWVRRRYIKPEFCEKCGIEPPRDLANKTGLYLRDLSDWDYLCRRCHMNSDNRNNRLIASGKSRKHPDKKCLTCGVDFHPVSLTSKFCNRQCYMAAGGRHSILKEKRA